MQGLRNIPVLSLPLLVSLLPACGMVQVSSQPGAASPSSASSGDEAERVKKTYASFGHQACKPRQCASAFLEAAAIAEQRSNAGVVRRFNPRASMPNPDPEWLPGWDKLPSADHANAAGEVYEALAVAANNRTWQARCNADWEKVQAELSAEDLEWQRAIADARRDKSWYGRVRALVGLRKRAKPREGSTYEARLHAQSGGPFALEAALFEEFAKGERQYVYFLQGVAPRKAARAELRPREEAGAERAMYCANAAAGKSSVTPANPYAGESLGGVVKTLFAKQELANLDAAWERAAKEASSRFVPPFDEGVVPEQPTAGAAAEGKGKLSGRPKLGFFDATSGFTVKTVRGEGERAVVTLERRGEGTFPWGCASSGHYDSFDAWGHLKMSEDCKAGQMTYEDAITVTFDELPVPLVPGDRVAFYGTVEKRTVHERDPAPGVRVSTTGWAVRGDVVVSVTRGGQTVAKLVER